MVDRVETNTSDLRGRKKARTRSSLRSAAIELAMELGPDQVTVEQICAAAEVSPRTFFNYFSSKDQALLGIDQDTLTRISQEIADRPAPETPMQVVAAILSGVIDNTTHSATWAAQIDLLRAHPELSPRMRGSTEAMKQALADGLAQRLGTAVRDPYVATVASTSMAALQVALTLWLDAAEGTDPRELLETVLDHLRNGLTPP